MKSAQSQIKHINRSAALRGLTLIDVVVTVMIVGIMAAVATPRFTNFYQTERLRAAGRKVISDLNLVQSWAMTTSTAQTITFHPIQDGYSVAGGLKHRRNRTEPFSTDLSVDPYWSRLSSVDFGGTATLSFNGSGIPDSGGSIVISNGSQSITVAVNAVTGIASIQ